ncbi:Uncharacterised protein [Mycobacteroides abscessus subsp. massiliense]|nr:Uncharacterised protein [Mycobacteroides abscessus subsp. massiliense]
MTSLTVHPGSTDGAAHCSSVKVAPSSSNAVHSAARAATTGFLATIVTVMVRAYEKSTRAGFELSALCRFTSGAVLG